MQNLLVRKATTHFYSKQIGHIRRAICCKSLASALCMLLFQVCAQSAALAQSNSLKGDQSNAETAEADSERSATARPTRLDFGSGQFLELAAIGDPDAQDFWKPDGTPTDKKYQGAESTPPLKIGTEQMKRQLFLLAKLPAGTSLKLVVPNQEIGGAAVSGRKGDPNKSYQSNQLAILSASQQTLSAKIQVRLPNWEAVADIRLGRGNDEPATNADVRLVYSKVLPNQYSVQSIGYVQAIEGLSPKESLRVIAIMADGSTQQPTSIRFVGDNNQIDATFETKSEVAQFLLQRASPGVEILCESLSLHAGQLTSPTFTIKTPSGRTCELDLTKDEHSLKILGEGVSTGENQTKTSGDAIDDNNSSSTTAPRAD